MSPQFIGGGIALNGVYLAKVASQCMAGGCACSDDIPDPPFVTMLDIGPEHGTRYAGVVRIMMKCSGCKRASTRRVPVKWSQL